MTAGGKTSVLQLLGGGGGGGDLVFPDQKVVTKVVISILVTISLARGHSIFLQLSIRDTQPDEIVWIYRTT